MSNKIINNAYRILGLLPNSTTKEVSKRLKNLDKLIRIGSIPDFDFDFGYFNQLRTEENMNIIKNILFNPKEQILHYFFSIYLQSEEQVNRLKELEHNFSIEKVYEYYNHRSDMITRKNSVLLMYLYLYINKDIKNEDTDKLIDDSLNFWKQILFSNIFFKTFKTMYLVDDEIGISEDLLDNVFEELQKEIIKAYSELIEVRNEPKIISKLVNVFDLKDLNISIQQVDECYKNIDNSIEVLDAMNISEDGIFDNNEKRTIKKSLSTIQDNLNILIDYGFYDDSRTIVLRDRIVRVVRNQIIDLHNNLSERKTALNLINFAIKICGTEGLKLSLEEEKHIIENIAIYDNINNIFSEAETDLKTIDSSYIDYLKRKISNLYKKMYDPDYKFANIIFYRLLNLSVKVNNIYKKSSISYDLLEIAKKYAKTEETKEIYKKNYDILMQNMGYSGYSNSNVADEGFGCLGEIIIRLIGFGLLYFIIALISVSCNGY